MYCSPRNKHTGVMLPTVDMLQTCSVTLVTWSLHMSPSVWRSSLASLHLVVYVLMCYLLNTNNDGSCIKGLFSVYGG